jgi:mRNA interferase MazF
MYLPSEIVLLPFPFTDLSAHKKRPVLILKKSNFQGDFLALQITSQSGFANALQLTQDDFVLGLLPKTSYVRPDKLITLNESLVIQRIGCISESAFTRIKQAICSNLDCFNSSN